MYAFFSVYLFATMNTDEINRISRSIVESCKVHKEIGPGLLEAIYERCLCSEFSARNLKFECQKLVPIRYKSAELLSNFRLDILVESTIVLEIKSVETILPVHEAQVLSYLRLSNKKLGFLVNFNVPVMKAGIWRFVNGL